MGARKQEPPSRGPAQALFRRNPSRLTQSLTCADKLCCTGRWPETFRSWLTREATMLLIPVVLVIGGILALVLYLEKRSPPYRE
jgi:hypothetical protein